MSPKDAAPAAYFTELFERVRRALVEQMAPARAGTLEVPVAPDPGALDHEGMRVAAQLRLDERTREVVVRFYDVQSGRTIRELPPLLVAAAAARLTTPAA